MSPPPTTIMIVVTLAVLMSAVNCYNDPYGICAGPVNVCRYSPNLLPPNVTQFDIYFNFHQHAFDSSTVCRRLYLIVDPTFEVYAYFSCNLDNCFNCYDDAFMRLRTTDKCSGKDGGFIALDGCCVRYETYNFCGAKI